MSAVGLGERNPLQRRRAAAESFMPKARDPEGETPEVPAASTVASEPASKSEGGEVPAPPPGREPKGRVQMNARVDAAKMRALKKYQHRHQATFQAVVDQMVDEYLGRRGLLPGE